MGFPSLIGKGGRKYFWGGGGWLKKLIMCRKEKKSNTTGEGGGEPFLMRIVKKNQHRQTEKHQNRTSNTLENLRTKLG